MSEDQAGWPSRIVWVRLDDLAGLYGLSDGRQLNPSASKFFGVGKRHHHTTGSHALANPRDIHATSMRQVLSSSDRSDGHLRRGEGGSQIFRQPRHTTFNVATVTITVTA
jgi:hypothetical protein